MSTQPPVTRTGHIFHTLTSDGMSVAVGVEDLPHGRTGLVVRTHVGLVVMALPVDHVSAAILSTLFDTTDTAAILARLAETR